MPRRKKAFKGMVLPAAATEHNSMPTVGTVYKTYQLVSLMPSVSQILFAAAKKSGRQKLFPAGRQSAAFSENKE